MNARGRSTSSRMMTLLVMLVTTTAVIDVTRHAAEELGFVRAGKAKVKLEVQK